MRQDWKPYARLVRDRVAHSPHGDKEAALKRSLTDESGWRNIDTARRAVAAIEFLDKLQELSPAAYAAISNAPFSVVDALARLGRQDHFLAIEAIRDWSEGNLSVHELRNLARNRLSSGLAGRFGLALGEKYREQAKALIRSAVQGLFDGLALAERDGSKNEQDAPFPDFQYSINDAKASLTQSVAVLVVGPYQNADLYRKRRSNWILRAFGLAWCYDHVVLVIPDKNDAKLYTTWVAEFQNRTIKSTGTSGLPHVHVIQVDVPKLSKEEEAAISSLADSSRQ